MEEPIIDWEEVEVQLQSNADSARMGFLCWRDDRSFYVQPQDGAPQKVVLVPSVIDGVEWTQPPFPQDRAPLKIEPCYLLPPPIYASIEDQSQSLDPEPWERAWWKAHGSTTLCLTDEDDEPLTELLEKHKTKAAIDYDRKKEQLAESNFTAKEKQRELEIIEREYNGPLHEFEEMEFSGILNMSLGMVKCGCGGIRDSYLLQWWAKEKKIGLETMAKQRMEFMRYLQSHAGKWVVNTDIRGGWKETAKCVVPLKLSGEEDPEFKTLCASVKYRVEFGGGTVAYLADRNVVKKLSPVELEKLARLGLDRHEREAIKHKEKETQASINNDEMIYSRKNSDGTILRQPAGIHMMRKKGIGNLLLRRGDLEVLGDKRVFTDTGLSFEAYLKQNDSLGYRKDGESDTSDFWYNKYDFIPD